jgi:hypothetical protein
MIVGVSGCVWAVSLYSHNLIIELTGELHRTEAIECDPRFLTPERRPGKCKCKNGEEGGDPADHSGDDPVISDHDSDPTDEDEDDSNDGAFAASPADTSFNFFGAVAIEQVNITIINNDPPPTTTVRSSPSLRYV